MANKVSVPFSLDEKHVNFIRTYGKGSNLSENLRAILDAAETNSEAIVKYSESMIANGQFTPVYQNPRAFMLYVKTQDSVEYGKDFPFIEAPPKRAKPEQLKALAEEAGFCTQTVEFLQHGFYALWASPSGGMDASRCAACRDKLQIGFNRLLESTCS
jgi:hypothetical protein